jgi:hypothetical protein
VQSNYLPWRGYFDLIRISNEFILLDTVQYTRRDGRNRNIIKTPAGPQCITARWRVKGKFHAAIDEIRIATPASLSSMSVPLRPTVRAAAFSELHHKAICRKEAPVIQSTSPPNATAAPSAGSFRRCLYQSTVLVTAPSRTVFFCNAATISFTASIGVYCA